MGRVSSMSSPGRLHGAYKDDSFRRSCGACIAIGLAGRYFEAHNDVSRP